MTSANYIFPRIFSISFVFPFILPTLCHQSQPIKSNPAPSHPHLLLTYRYSFPKPKPYSITNNEL